ncbi:MAG: hypothetical protein HUJ63_09255 [Enterococcus sp.]|nr:hypothetical protein [Enterococcus sp.]
MTDFVVWFVAGFAVGTLLTGFVMAKFNGFRKKKSNKKRAKYMKKFMAA